MAGLPEQEEDLVGEGRSGTSRQVVARMLRVVGRTALLAALGAAPLLAGSVHRPTATAVFAAVTVALMCAIVGQWVYGRRLQGARSCHFFLLLLLIPLVQAIPLPLAVRNFVDPAGGALLENAPSGAPAVWPLSLDPLGTRGEIGIAAAGLAVFLLALNVAAGRTRYTPIAKVVAISGAVAVGAGLTQRLFGVAGLYGMFHESGGIFNGPFINPNHSAEFYELAGFAALALAFDTIAEVRIAWYAVAGINAAAALATLSRGAIVGLVAGIGSLLLLRSRRVASEDGEEPAPKSRGLVWTLAALGIVVAFALALGAAPLADEIARSDFSGATEKPAVWKDSLALVISHPAGIGRHAFDRVYPTVRTLSWPVRFNFVENGPLQLLIDVGWVGLAALVLSFGALAARMLRRGRKDAVEAALLAGLAAVGMHNLVDFGLETSGIRLPFAALAGAALGRLYGRDKRSGVARGPTLLAATAGLGLGIGFVALWQTGPDDLEKRWHASTSPAERRTIAVEAGTRVPTDYFFPLLQSFDEPFSAGTARGRSPKLAALNRALRLCPSCPAVHRETARALYRGGLRPQALASFRDTVRADTAALPDVLIEADRLGYAPAQLATFAVAGSAQTITVADYLAPKRAAAEVKTLLEQASAQGASPTDIALVTARLALAEGRLAQARATLAGAAAASPVDARVFALLATVEQKAEHWEEALASARRATTLVPASLPYARQRVQLVIEAARWSELDPALEALKSARRRNGTSIIEVYFYAAQAHERRGNLARAAVEYRNAVTIDPGNVFAWSELARVKEKDGDLLGGKEAYEKLATLKPGDPSVREALERIQKLRVQLEVMPLAP
jgi:tetratricopeptide (TPR) repeat protein